MQLLYRVFITLYGWGIRLAALGQSKARRWVQGRKGLEDRICGSLSTEERNLVWMHCASLGEFEQGRPVLEAIRERYPRYAVMLTFFSPSGFEVCRNYSGADYVFYLPLDTPSGAGDFLESARPALALFVKYEFWYYYLRELKARGIPTVLISAAFRKGQPFFRWYGAFWRRMLDAFDCFFVQDDVSAALLERIGAGARTVIAGDTRFDRVLEILGRREDVPFIDAFVGSHLVVVAGSTWSEDEKELAHFVRKHPQVRFIIAPHEVSREHIKELSRYLGKPLLYSQLSAANGAGSPAGGSGGHATETHCLLVDSVGLLSRLYRYATVAFIGGGFGADGVHNVLEAAVWGKPVVYGPVFDKYPEAAGLVDEGGGFTAFNTLELEACLEGLLNDAGRREAAGLAAEKFVRKKAGATRKILEGLQEKRLLTN